MARVLSWVFRRPVSSAKWNRKISSRKKNLIEMCKSFMYKRKNRGPRTGPCGTPKLTLSRSDKIPSIETYCILFVRQDLNQS